MTTTVAELQVVVDGQADGANSVLDSTGKKVDAMGGKGERSGRRMAKGMALGGAALTALGAAAATGAAAGIGVAIKSGSDLNETMNVTNEVFPELSASITAAADEAGKLGVIKTEFLEGANAFGLLAQGAGLAEKEAADLSVGFANLAGDASSFYNVPVDQALQDIRSGLSGESEPLKKYGILLNEAAVKSKAVELGLAGANGELSTAAKTQARAALITEGFAKAQGDLARTSDSVANRSRALKGTLANIAAEAGQALLPVAQGFLGTLQSMLSELGPVITQVLADIAPVLSLLGESLGGVLAALLPTLAPVVQVFGTVAAELGNVLAPILTALGPIIGELAVALGDVLLALMPLLPPIGELLVAVAPLLPAIAQLAATLVSALVPAIRPGIQLLSLIASVITAVVTPALEWVANVIDSVVAPALAALYKPIETVIGWFRELWYRVVGGSYIPDLVSGVLRFIGKLVTFVPRLIISMATKALSAFSGFAGRFLSAGKDLIAGFIRGIGSMAGAVASKAKEVVGGAVSRVKKFLRLGSPSRLFEQYGAWTGQGLAIGLDGQKSNVASSGGGLANALSRAFTPPDLSTPVPMPAVAGAAPVAAGAAPGPAGGAAAAGRAGGGVHYEFHEGAIVINGGGEPSENNIARALRKASIRQGAR